MQAQAAAAGRQEPQPKALAFLAKNKAAKGVFTTGSGLQYMILRQGAGARPKPTDAGPRATTTARCSTAPCSTAPTIAASRPSSR